MEVLPLAWYTVLKTAGGLKKAPWGFNSLHFRVMSEEHYHDVLSKMFLEMVEKSFDSEEKKVEKIFWWGQEKPLIRVTVDVLP